MRLIGSTNSLDSLELLIKQRWAWNYVILTPIEDKLWSVANGNGLVDGILVCKVGGRYRLEMKED